MCTQNSVVRFTVISCVAIFLSLFNCGCRENREKTLADPCFLLQNPVVTISKAPDFSDRKFSKVYIAPASEVSKRREFDNQIIEEGMCFQLQCALEHFGYEIVNSPEKSELIATVTGSNAFETFDVPPSVVTLPKYTPGQTYSTNSAFSIYGSNGGSLPLANVYGQSTTTTQGTWRSETITRPGYRDGNYFPHLRITAVNAQSGKELYVATATGSSLSNDIRVATSVLFVTCMQEFPYSSTPIYTNKNGVLGIRFVIRTVNGIEFYPYTAPAVKNSPAEMAGVSSGMRITEIDGVKTKNLTHGQVVKIFDAGGPATTLLVEKYSDSGPKSKTLTINRISHEEMLRLSK